MRLPRKSICFILLATAAVGCHTNSPILGGGWFDTAPPPMVLDGTRAQMRAEVLSHVPVGTSLEEARAVMKRNGFVCQAADDGSPPALICTKRRQSGPELAYEWRIELRHDGQKVTGVDAGLLGYGPEEAEPAAAE